METFENNDQKDTYFISTKEINDYLLETSRWGKLLAIVGYVSITLLVLLALFIMFGFSQISSLAATAFPFRFMGVIYMLIALLYYFPTNYLYKFSVQIKVGVNSNDTSTIAHAFQNLKSLFKFIVIILSN